MSEFPREARISARVHESDKVKLKKSGYNARQAIEYFNSLTSKKIDSLKIEEYFLNKEIEDLKDILIVKERKLDLLQKAIDDYHIDKVSSLRVDSYQRIISKFNSYNTTDTFEEFVSGEYVRSKFIEREVEKFPDCDMDDFCGELLEYYQDVILVGKTF